MASDKPTNLPGDIMKLRDKVILITGGTSGIGFALAAQLLERGNTVIVTGRDAHRLEQTRVALPGVRVFQSDVSDAGAITQLHDAVTTQFPTLDIVINNAGIMRSLDMNAPRDLTDVTREIEINLSGPVRMIQQFLPHLKRQKNAAIINVTSALAFMPLPLSPVYSATKAALHSFTQALRIQLADSSVRVIELAPPGVETPLLRGAFDSALHAQKGMDVQALARITISAIEAGKLEIRPGLSNLLKIMSRLAPQLALKQMAKMSQSKASR
jgi:uncharacterized oxidoreductase